MIPSAYHPVDPAISALLPPSLTPADTKITRHGGAGMSSASTFKITVTTHPDAVSNTKTTSHTGDPPTTMTYFLKTSPHPTASTMFAGEHASLCALHAAVPTLCPRSYGHGELREIPGTFFLVTEFLSLERGGRGGCATRDSLARKLARLHTTPAPAPEGFPGKPQFGFPVPTCCGDTVQSNTFHASWAGFFAEERLRFIVREGGRGQGEDGELEGLVERVAGEVVPRLLGEGHLGGAKGVGPVVVHGDLWSGNWGVGCFEGRTEDGEGGGTQEEVVFDPSACYAHSEYELGIMNMFGGAGGSTFLDEYHSLVPKTEPVEEYGDRVLLYELYHHLNHYALFGGGYRGGAVRIMKRLLGKYGS